MKRNTWKKMIAFVMAFTLVAGTMPANVDGGGLFDTAIVIGLMPGMGLTAYAASTYSLVPAQGQSGETYSITPSEDTLDAVKTALAAEMSLDTETKEIWLCDEDGMFELDYLSDTMYYKVKSKPQEIVAGKTYVIGDSLYFYADKYYNNGSVQKGSSIFSPGTDFSKAQEFENISASDQVRLAGFGGQSFILEEPSDHTFDSSVQPIGFKLADDSGDGSTEQNYIKFEAVYASPKTDQTVTAPVAVSNLTYTGSAQTLVSAATVTTGNTSGSITYSLDGTNYSADLPTGTNAGTYNVYYKVAGNDDYNEFVSASPVSVSIGKADPTADKFTFTAPSNLTYNGTAKSATVTTKEGVNGMGSFTVKYYSDENRTNEVTERKNAGTYYVGIKVNNGDNYNASENNMVLHGDNWQFTIAKADPTANAPTGLTATYGQTLADVTLPDGWTWADSTQSVGSVVSPAATFKANFAGNDNYNAASNVDVTVTVNKAANPATVTNTATVTRGGNTIDLASSVTLNGATGEVTYAIDGEANGCTLAGRVLTSGTSTGTVKVNVTVAADNNYEALAATPINVTISDKNTQTITANDVTVTYGDTNKKVTASVSNPTTGGGAISYAVKDGSEEYISVDATTGALTINKVPTNGVAYVIVTAAETQTYAQATKDVTVTINKAPALKTAPTSKNPTRYSSAVQLVNAGTTATEECTMYYLVADAKPEENAAEWSTTIPTANAKGTYKVWYKVTVTGNTNYADTAVCETPVIVTVTQYTAPTTTKSSQTWTLTMDSYPYDGTAHEAKITGNAYGKIIYYYYNADTDELLDQAPSEVGNYRVRVYASGSTSYYSRIQTAEYSITNPVDPIDENGMASVEKFKNSDTIPTIEGKIFAGWFTDSTCTTPYTEDSGKAYAKFIDENILTVKAQISSGTTANSETTSIRFITSVDSLKYQNVGFKITYNGKTIDKQMTKVYTALNANGKKISPKVFSEESNYMEAYTLNNIPQSAFSKEFMVTPYYTTQDGTIVEGKTNTFTIANMIK